MILKISIKSLSIPPAYSRNKRTERGEYISYFLLIPSHRLLLLILSNNCSWDWARKNLSPAFSNTNLVKTLPEIHKKTAEFTDILDQHIDEGKDLEDFSRWMVKLTIDFISTTMFATDFQTLSHEDPTAICPTYGSIYLTHLSIAIRVHSHYYCCSFQYHIYLIVYPHNSSGTFCASKK